MDLLSLLIAIFYTLVVVGICGYLLSRGFTQSFILWFGAGAILQAVPRIGFHFLQQAPGGIASNLRWMPAFSAVGMLGVICFVTGFVALAAFLVRTSPPAG